MFGTGHNRNARDPAKAVASVLRDRDAATERAGRIAVAAMLSARHLSQPIDLQRALEMALAQALTADDIHDRIGPDDGLHLRALFLELQTGGTSEARLVHSLGDLLDGRTPRGRDPLLSAIGQAMLDEPAATG